VPDLRLALARLVCARGHARPKITGVRTRWVYVAALALVLQSISGSSGAQVDPRTLDRAAHDTDDHLPADATDDCELSVRPGEVSGREELPRDETCIADLTRRAVTFVAAHATGVSTPLTFPGVHGVEISPRSHRATEHDVADCTLVAALSRWAGSLRADGIRALQHMSIYRHAARVRTTGRPSGHATGMAIDVSHFDFDDGTSFSVEDDWAHADHGVSPCISSDDETEHQRRVRRVVCTASESGLFQVVLTPHHDPSHRNHVHLEVRPDVTWRVLE
jgi:hypothetical protein